MTDKDNDSTLATKKSEKLFGAYNTKHLSLQRFLRKVNLMFGLWCNGSTTGFGSVCPGSNPGSPTLKALKKFFSELFFLYTLCYLFFPQHLRFISTLYYSDFTTSLCRFFHLFCRKTLQYFSCIPC